MSSEVKEREEGVKSLFLISASSIWSLWSIWSVSSISSISSVWAGKGETGEKGETSLTGIVGCQNMVNDEKGGCPCLVHKRACVFQKRP